MTMPTPRDPDAAPAGFDEIGLIEFDETIPPRPEEDAADAARAVPDIAATDLAATDLAATDLAATGLTANDSADPDGSAAEHT